RHTRSKRDWSSDVCSSDLTDAYYGAMGRHNTIPDQIAGMKELAKKYPWIDIDKAAMWGHSGGGFITADALLRAPYSDFFKVGIRSEERRVGKECRSRGMRR